MHEKAWVGNLHDELAALWCTPLRKPTKREGFLPATDYEVKPPIFLVPDQVEILVGVWAELLRNPNVKFADVLCPQASQAPITPYRSSVVDVRQLDVDVEETKTFEARRPEDHFGASGDLRGRLLPLKPLYLTPFPESGSLWMFLATRLKDLLEGILEGHTFDQSWSHENPILTAFRRVQEAIGAGWESNLRDRAASMDPETWALESEHTELLRMNAPRAWAECLDVLAEATYREFRSKLTVVQDLRIVLPILDVQFNPNRARELFGLFRMLRHPRLIFLLDGDPQYLESMAREASVPMCMFTETGKRSV